MTGNGIGDVTQHTRLAGVEDLEAIGEILPLLGGPFYSERYPGKTSAEFCRWKYFENPAGEAAVGVAVESDRVVGVVAATPKRVRIDGGVVLAFELGDFITLPEYRGRGLFSKLIELVCDAACQREAEFVYVRPNEMSFPILKARLSFAEPANLDARRYVVPSRVLQRKLGVPAALFRSVGVDSAMRKAALANRSKLVEVESVTRFDQRMDRLWERVQDSYRLALLRDSKFLNWRYVDCPTPYRRWLARKGDEVSGFLIAFAETAEPNGMIVDLFTHPGDVESATALLRAAIDEMEVKGKSAIYTWTLQSEEHSAPAKVLKRACRLVSPPALHVAVKFLGREVDALPETGWHLAAGDFDGI